MSILDQYFTKVFAILIIIVPLPILSNSGEHNGVHDAPSPGDIENILAQRILYANGDADFSLPTCEPRSVCNRINTYDKPWVEKLCHCKDKKCSESTSQSDGFTITDKIRQYKLCEPTTGLKTCRHFRDITWILITRGDTLMEQKIQCKCPKDSTAYLIRRQSYRFEDRQIGYKYSFACSPQRKILCQRKEPCRLFTLKVRSNLINEFNTNTLCQCPNGFKCPTHHVEPGVISGKYYPENMIKTYSGYCTYFDNESTIKIDPSTPSNTTIVAQNHKPI